MGGSRKENEGKNEVGGWELLEFLGKVKQGMKGLVLDLRDNGGGLLDAVVEMLDYILPAGMIVYTEDKYGNREEYKGTNKDVLELPMTVLVNGNSASASEIFAAALQDYKAATVIGTTTFGKGIVQTVLPLTDGTAVKITISRYFTPNGVWKKIAMCVIISLDDLTGKSCKLLL